MQEGVLRDTETYLPASPDCETKGSEPGPGPPRDPLLGISSTFSSSRRLRHAALGFRLRSVQ